MKRICFIIDSLSGGGAERLILNLSRELVRQGAEVHVILLENLICYELQDYECYFHVLTENGRIVKNKLLNKVVIARRLKQLISQLEERHGCFDLIISNREDSGFLVAIAKLKNVYRCYLTSISNFLEGKIKHENKIKERFRHLKFFGRHKFMYNDRRMIAVSHGVKRDIVGCGVKPKSISVIYSGFNFDEVRNAANVESKSIPEERYIINVARFSIQKRHDILIHAYHRAQVEHKLVLLGTYDKPADQNNLKSLKALVKRLDIEDKVLFSGFQANPYPWVKNADLFVLASDFEGLPSVVIEALILGTMVVSTDCPYGPGEILTGELSQYLSPVGDVQALADNIKHALEHPITIREQHVALFNSTVVAKQYLALCEGENS